RIPLLASSITLDVALFLARDPQGAGRHVVGDDAAGARVRTFAERDRGDQRRVHARADVVADRGAVLRAAVVVGGDGGGTEIGVGAHVGVADVGEGRDLGP